VVFFVRCALATLDWKQNFLFNFNSGPQNSKFVSAAFILVVLTIILLRIKQEQFYIERIS